MLLLNNLLKTFFWHLTLVNLQKYTVLCYWFGDVNVGKWMQQEFTAHLFFNGASTQKPIDVDSLLLAIPPDPCSSLQESEHKMSCWTFKILLITPLKPISNELSYKRTNYLFIIGRIPIRIKENQSISTN